MIKADLSEGDIIALLNSWWPKSSEQFPGDVTVNFKEVDSLVLLPPGSTIKYIGVIVKRKSFRCISVGDSVGSYEYDISIDDFGKMYDPESDPDY